MHHDLVGISSTKCERTFTWERNTGLCSKILFPSRDRDPEFEQRTTFDGAELKENVIFSNGRTSETRWLKNSSGVTNKLWQWRTIRISGWVCQCLTCESLASAIQQSSETKTELILTYSIIKDIYYVWELRSECIHNTKSARHKTPLNSSFMTLYCAVATTQVLKFE